MWPRPVPTGRVPAKLPRIPSLALGIFNPPRGAGRAVGQVVTQPPQLRHPPESSSPASGSPGRAQVTVLSGPAPSASRTGSPRLRRLRRCRTKAGGRLTARRNPATHAPAPRPAPRTQPRLAAAPCASRPRRGGRRGEARLPAKAPHPRRATPPAPRGGTTSLSAPPSRATSCRGRVGARRARHGGGARLRSWGYAGPVRPRSGLPSPLARSRPAPRHGGAFAGPTSGASHRVG